MKKVRSSQASISINFYFESTKRQFLPESIVKTKTISHFAVKFVERSSRLLLENHLV